MIYVILRRICGTLTPQHTKYHGAILAFHYGIQAKEYGDTLGMARYVFDEVRYSLDYIARLLGLQDKGDALEATKGKHELTEEESTALAEYAVGDTVICRDIYRKLYTSIPPAERALLD